MAANVPPAAQVRNRAGLGTVTSARMLSTAAPIRIPLIAALAAAALAASASPAAARLPGDAHYLGETEEGYDVGLRLGESGRYVARLRISYDVSCDNGAEGTPSTTVFDVPLRRRGRFSYKGTYIGREDGSKNRVTLRGRVTRRVARGTFLLVATGRPEGSDEKVRCKSETVSWRADREQ
jgi:hypothetical protein